MENCIFCKIVKGEIPTAILYENEEVVAFKDIHPQAPVHLLIIPKKHITSLVELKEEDYENVMPKVFEAINHLARENHIDQEGFRVVNNCGDNGGQTVHHLHFHLLGGRKMLWPPG